MKTRTPKNILSFAKNTFSPSLRSFAVDATALVLQEDHHLATALAGGSLNTAGRARRSKSNFSSGGASG
ncbi:MAG: hypothetical protein EDM05_67255 [Leptolyngbya sp. IPPAS B-1204]|nr:hypothetical protein [Elainella sp. C42_A2020_010]